MLEDMRHSAKPYRDRLPRNTQLPGQGRDRAEILAEVEMLQAEESSRWRDGFVSGAVYHGDDAHIDFLNQVYARCSQSNPLHADLWPSVVKYEAEIVAMTGAMLGSAHVGGDDEVCGAVSSGGTESIMLAMKTYRDQARQERGIKQPQMVVPTTAHAAFDKASRYFGIEMIKVPVGSDYRADVAATKRAIGRNTVVVVGSAPSFPHGVIDPIEELSQLAHRRGVGFHTDACLGGFVLPWARELGYHVPQFDFQLPGVTSISADTHKYGYAAKGTSVVLYRSPELRRHQWYTTTDWPGGLYLSPTFAGSRPGALSAACWAAMMSMGADGYRDATRRILETAASIRAGIEGISELRVLGDPLWVIAFASEDGLDIYRVMDRLTHRGWSLNGLHRPACIHICVTLRHAEPGVAERFVADLREAVDHVKSQPATEGGMAPIYGLAGTLPVRGAISDVLARYLDVLYEV
ncbi:MAG: aminotransferase class V-fold PLP-dependent enzyme [Deltaproteobacteria bacterium]|nr:aminotransferase class V-fold PLP-dependent enzyme [Deltaproteobacteria bacterium]